jgi:hypothetical protein
VWTRWTAYLRTFSTPAGRAAFPERLPPRNRVPAKDAVAVTVAANANAAAAAAGGPATAVAAAAAAAAAKAAKAVDEAADAAYLQPLRDFMRAVPLQKIFGEAAESGKYGYLPLVATHSRCGVGSPAFIQLLRRRDDDGDDAGSWVHWSAPQPSLLPSSLPSAQTPLAAVAQLGVPEPGTSAALARAPQLQQAARRRTRARRRAARAVLLIAAGPEQEYIDCTPGSGTAAHAACLVPARASHTLPSASRAMAALFKYGVQSLAQLQKLSSARE